jgi:hypothetical protein
MGEAEYQSYRRIEDLSDLMGRAAHRSPSPSYRHGTRPALTTGATAMNKILSRKRVRSAWPVTERQQDVSTGVAPRLAPEDPKGAPDEGPEPLLACRALVGTAWI